MKNFKFFKGVDGDKRINDFVILENPLHGLIQYDTNNREIEKQELNILMDQPKKNISLFEKLFIYLKHQYDSIFNPLN